ncbi:ADP-glyceromanno-heptose 6-epimerase [Butyrivibrio sp. LC3010]|uniref:ADP-glyceromanno-heptose 6-epimerase n=1 Tax=Butyrivibrio sp. LC3010 TaxID=1280680 RepID=UPI0003FF2E52|nr:ADP-glyceromanno-heptose 6-epimerase [Butyrivibrio sp. LC3010]
MSYLVTGGAGFIGSNVVEALNHRGIEDVIIVDNISSTEKWKNICGKKYTTYIHKKDLWRRIDELNNIDAIIHMGACSSTTERDFDYLWNNNFEYTKSLWNLCAERKIPFIYASSAATYGDGRNGFDDETDIDFFRPLNGYGYSKQLFDLWVKYQAKTFPSQHVGLKFFNVYGPGEYFKGSMASMAFHGYIQAKQDGEIRLFKSYNDEYADGGQLRDFVYVKDVCDVILWFLDHPDKSGLFNVGTGKADSFENLAKAVFKAINKTPNIRYIEMPDYLKGKYQYYTQANINKLRKLGCNIDFKSVNYGVDDYIKNYLAKERMLVV